MSNLPQLPWSIASKMSVSFTKRPGTGDWTVKTITLHPVPQQNQLRPRRPKRSGDISGGSGVVALQAKRKRLTQKATSETKRGRKQGACQQQQKQKAAAVVGQKKVKSKRKAADGDSALAPAVLKTTAMVDTKR